MCLGGSPSAPAAPPRLPEAAKTPDKEAGRGRLDKDKRRRAAAAGTGSGTILTGSSGVSSSGAAPAVTLLGQ